MTLQIKIINSLDKIDEDIWDSCSNSISSKGKPYDPFTTYRFLRALEKSKSVGEGTGWYPQHLLALRNKEVVGVVPMYLKSNSQGEYIFDHNWAHAYQNAGGSYYPKLQISVPFTPATGRRFLLKYENDKDTPLEILKYIKSLSTNNKLSSVHITFCEIDEKQIPIREGFLSRETYQFHWKNYNFKDFEEFLGKLSSRKRKAIKKERKVANSFGGKIVQYSGDNITMEHWHYFWKFYQDTGKRKWGAPYLTWEFFKEIHKTMRNDILLVLALNKGEAIAGALNFVGSKTLFGRYWGATEYHKFLHYELCYYQAIDYAINNGLEKVEAGAQGDHKISRGYLPHKTHSLHWFLHNGMHEAIQNYLVGEKESIDFDTGYIRNLSPFKELN